MIIHTLNSRNLNVNPHVFYRATLACYVLSSCVRLSVTRRYCTKTPKCKITQTTPYNNFLTPKISAKFQRERGIK